MIFAAPRSDIFISFPLHFDPNLACYSTFTYYEGPRHPLLLSAVPFLLLTPMHHITYHAASSWRGEGQRVRCNGRLYLYTCTVFPVTATASRKDQNDLPNEDSSEDSTLSSRPFPLQQHGPKTLCCTRGTRSGVSLYSSYV